MPANNTAAVRAGRAFIELFVEDGQLEVGLRAAQRRMRQFAGTVRTMGASMLSGGILANFGLGVATKIFADFEDQMSIVRGIIAGTETDFVGLREEVMRLGRTTSFTAREVASAVVELTRGGLSGAQAKAALADTLNLARGGNVELAEAARTIVTTISQFGLKAEDASIAANVLAKAANMSASDVTDLAEALKFAGVTGAMIGEDIYSVAAGLAIMANAGVRGTLAGTQLGRVYKELAVGLKQQKIWDELGVKVTNFAGNMRATAEVMADIRDAMDARKWSQGRRLSFLDEVFGRGINAAALLGNTRAEFERLRKELQLSQGYADRLARAMDDNLGGSFRIALSAIEGVALALGESMNDAIRWVADSFARLSVLVSEWIGRNKELVVSIAKAVAMMIPMGAGLLAFAAGIRLVNFTVGSLFTVVQMGIPVVGALGTALAAVGGAMMFVGAKAGPVLVGFLGSVAKLSVEATQSILSLAGALAGMAAGVARTALAAIGAVVAQLTSAVTSGSQAAAAAAQTAVPAAAAAASAAARQTQAAAAAAGQAASKLPSVMDIVRASALSLANGLRLVEQAIAATFAALARGGVNALRATARGLSAMVQSVVSLGRSLVATSVDAMRFGADVASASARAAESAAKLANVAAAARTVPSAFSAMSRAAQSAVASVSGSIVRFFTVGGPFDKAINAAVASIGRLAVSMARQIPMAFGMAIAEGRHVVSFYATAIPNALRAVNSAVASLETALLAFTAKGLRPAVASVGAFADVLAIKLAKAARSAASALRVVSTALVDSFSAASQLFAGFARMAVRQLAAVPSAVASTLAATPRILATAFVTLETVVLRGLIASLNAIPKAAAAVGVALGALARTAVGGLTVAFAAAQKGVASFAGAVASSLALASASIGKAFSVATAAVVGFGRALVGVATGAISLVVAATQSLVAVLSVVTGALAAAAAAALKFGAVLFSSVIAALATVATAAGLAAVAIWGVQGAIDKAKSALSFLGDLAGKIFSYLGSAAASGAEAVISAMSKMFDYIGATMDRAARMRDASYMPEFERDRRLLDFLAQLDKAGRLTMTQAEAARQALASLRGTYGDISGSLVEIIDAEGNVWYELRMGADAFNDSMSAIDASNLGRVTRQLEIVRDTIRSLNEQLAQTPYNDAAQNAALADRLDEARAQEQRLLELEEQIKRRQAEVGALDPNDPIAIQRREELAMNDRSRAILDDLENERINAIERMRGAVEDSATRLGSDFQGRIDREMSGEIDPEAERARIERRANRELVEARRKALVDLEKLEKRFSEEISSLRGQGLADEEIKRREIELQEELNDIREGFLRDFADRREEIEQKAASEIVGIYQELERKKKELEEEIEEQRKVLSGTAGTFSGRLVTQIGDASSVNKSLLGEAKNTNRILGRIENKIGGGGFMVGAN